MKKSLLICIVLVPFFLSNAQTLEEIKAKIKVLQNNAIQTMLAGDFTSGLEHYTDDAYSLPSYEPMMHGKEAMLAASETASEGGMKFISFEMNTVDVFMSGNLVVEIGTYATTMQMPGMPMDLEDVGKYLNVFEIQEDGSLKVKAETWNTDNNPWMQMESDMPPPPPEK